jgi:hypothetical protein
MWENTEVVTMVVSVVVGYEDRKRRNNWYDEECQIKGDEKVKPKSKC